MEALKHKVAIATVYGRSYYKIINALKLMELQFVSLSPEQAAMSNAKIIITTKDEADIVKRKDIVLDTELDNYPVLIKAKILRNVMGYYQDDQLTIGVDPGHRIGISVIYFHNEIASMVESSPDSVIQLISVLLSGIISTKKILRIGDGNISMAKYIASIIKGRFNNLVRIEIVNEYGTSLPSKTDINRRGARDVSSARAIALRMGRCFNSCATHPSNVKL
jgi:hypothetical protein